MGFDRHYLKQINFVLSKVSGELNDQDLMQQVVSLNRETEGMSDVTTICYIHSPTGASSPVVINRAYHNSDKPFFRKAKPARLNGTRCCVS